MTDKTEEKPTPTTPDPETTEEPADDTREPELTSTIKQSAPPPADSSPDTEENEPEESDAAEATAKAPNADETGDEAVVAKPKAGAGSKASSDDPPLDLDADGRERPAFLRSFPKDEALQKLVRAFERGDYLEVNRAAPELIEKTKDKAVKRAATELLERTKPDPLMKYLLAASAVFMLYLIFYAYSQSGH